MSTTNHGTPVPAERGPGDMIHVTSCPCCGAMAQAIACEGAPNVTGYRHVDLAGVTPLEMFNDMSELLRILDLGDHARPESAHQVMQGEIIPAVRSLVTRLELSDPLLCSGCGGPATRAFKLYGGGRTGRCDTCQGPRQVPPHTPGPAKPTREGPPIDCGDWLK